MRTKSATSRAILGEAGPLAGYVTAGVLHNVVRLHGLPRRGVGPGDGMPLSEGGSVGCRRVRVAGTGECRTPGSVQNPPQINRDRPDRPRYPGMRTKPATCRAIRGGKRGRLAGYVTAGAQFTYLAPVLTDVTGLGAGWVPVMLALFGLGSFAGVTLAGRYADRRDPPIGIRCRGHLVARLVRVRPDRVRPGRGRRTGRRPRAVVVRGRLDADLVRPLCRLGIAPSWPAASPPHPSTSAPPSARSSAVPRSL
jgi:hypothetical protein